HVTGVQTCALPIYAEHERGESDRDQVDYTDPHGVPEVPGHRPEEEADALGADREDEGATQDLETSSGVYRVEHGPDGTWQESPNRARCPDKSPQPQVGGRYRRRAERSRG